MRMKPAFVTTLSSAVAVGPLAGVVRERGRREEQEGDEDGGEDDRQALHPADPRGCPAMGSLVRERRDDGIEVLRLDRPQARNALGSAQLAELEAALAELARDDGLRALVLSTTDVRGAVRRAPTWPRSSTARRRRADGGLHAGLRGLRRRPGAERLRVRRQRRRRGRGDRRGLRPARRRRQPQAHVGRGAAWARPSARRGSCRWSGSRRAKELVFTGRVVGMRRPRRIGLLHRTARRRRGRGRRDRAGRARWPPTTPAGVRAPEGDVLRARGEPARVAHENELLVAWQREGSGLPSGGVPR